MHFKKSHVVLSWTALVLILLGGLILTGHDRCAFAPGDPLLDPEGCTVVVVGKDASVDGSVMTTHTCDCSMCDWTWRSVPAQTYREGASAFDEHLAKGSVRQRITLWRTTL